MIAMLPTSLMAGTASSNRERTGVQRIGVVTDGRSENVYIEAGAARATKSSQPREKPVLAPATATEASTAHGKIMSRKFHQAVVSPCFLAAFAVRCEGEGACVCNVEAVRCEWVEVAQKIQIRNK